jgi:electron transfer flavoprotein alpha subunit
MPGVLALSLLPELSGLRAAFELCAGGRALAGRLGTKLQVALIGKESATLAEECAMRAVDEVCLAEHELLGPETLDLLLAAAEQVCRQHDPAVILLSGDARGQALAPRLAARLKAGLVSDCVGIDVDPKGAVLATRPVYGGKAMAVLTATTHPFIIAVRPRSLEPAVPVAAHKAGINRVALSLTWALEKSKVVERADGGSGVGLEDARIIVSGGRGIGGQEGFKVLRELAEAINGALAASRAACDSGWVPAEWQVGQTGKKVAPELYLAIGISGASQHLAGMSQSRHIVAINKDPDAPIFKAAELGVVDEYQKIIPLLTRCLRVRLGK